MDKFKFAYGNSVRILLALAIPLSAAGLVWNIYNLVALASEGIFKILAYSISIIVCGGLFAFCISLALYGKYVFKDGYLYLYFGFIRTKTKAEDILQVTHFLKSDKLVIYFKDAKYSVVVISPELYGEFVSALKRANPSIIYDASEEREEK